MTDVSLPPTHPDDELVTRKILREELAKELSNYPSKAELREELAKEFGAFRTDLTRQFNAMHEEFMSEVRSMLDPLRELPVRVSVVERRTVAHDERITMLEARRQVRRRPRKKASRK